MGKRVDWESVRVAYVNGTETTQDLAERLQLSHAAVRKQAERGKWADQRRVLSQQVAQQAQESLAQQRVKELAEFNRQDAAMSRALRSVAARMLADANKDGGKKLTATEARTIASLAEAAQKIGRIALDATTENLGHGGLAGAPPVVFGAALPEDVKRAMDAYLSDY